MAGGNGSSSSAPDPRGVSESFRDYDSTMERSNDQELNDLTKKIEALKQVSRNGMCVTCL